MNTTEGKNISATLDDRDSLPDKAAEPCQARREFTKQTPEAVNLVQRIVVNWEPDPLCHPPIQAAIKAKPPGLNSRIRHRTGGSRNLHGQNMSVKRIVNRIAGSFKVNLRGNNERPASTAHQCPLTEIQRADFLPMDLPVIRILVIYEHDLNRDRAGLLQEELARRLGRCFTLLVSWWKLKSLWHPKMLRLAADHLANADIVLFSLLSGGELPKTVTKYIEKGLLHSTTRRVSLLALLETGGMIAPRLSPAEIYLSHLASKAGVDCLCYSDGIPLPR